MLPAERHSNPEVLEAAYYYAKGRGLKSKPAASGVRNTRITGAGRPASPSGGMGPGARGKVTPKLTAIQDSARKAAGMSVDEYVKYMRKK